jgi:DNA-binding XRE family transcriptional regulator
LLARLGDEDAEDRMTLIITAEARSQTALPEPMSKAILGGDTTLKALRNWRGATQAQLAAAAQINKGYLSELEAGAKTGSPQTLAKLANSLDVPAGWLG